MPRAKGPCSSRLPTKQRKCKGKSSDHRSPLIHNENAPAEPWLDRAPRDTHGPGEFNAGRVARATKHGARAILAGLPCQADQSKSARYVSAPEPAVGQCFKRRTLARHVLLWRRSGAQRKERGFATEDT